MCITLFFDWFQWTENEQSSEFALISMDRLQALFHKICLWVAGILSVDEWANTLAVHNWIILGTAKRAQIPNRTKTFCVYLQDFRQNQISLDMLQFYKILKSQCPLFIQVLFSHGSYLPVLFVLNLDQDKEKLEFSFLQEGYWSVTIPEKDFATVHL